MFRRSSFALAAFSLSVSVSAQVAFVPTDPNVSDQDYLEQANIFDLNMDNEDGDIAAWTLGYTGEGVTVAILGTGLVDDHREFRDKIDFRFDNDGETDGPITRANATLMAGIIAAEANNDFGLSGIAPDAHLGDLDIVLSNGFYLLEDTELVPFLMEGIGVNASGTYLREADFQVRVLDPGGMIEFDTDENSAEIALSSRNNVIDVIGAGENRGVLMSELSGVLPGGNSTKRARLNDPNLIVVTALTDASVHSTTANLGSNIFVAAPGETLLTTTSLANSGILEAPGSTREAAAVVAGVLALAKEAVPDLHVRAAQHSLARTSRLIDSADSGGPPDIVNEDNIEGGEGWLTNAAGFTFNNNYGFGLIDAGAFIRDAVDVAYVTEQTVHTTGPVQVDQRITDFTGFRVEVDVPDAIEQPLESVTVRLTLEETQAGLFDEDGNPVPQVVQTGFEMFVGSPALGQTSTDDNFLGDEDSPVILIGGDRSTSDANNVWDATTYAFWGEDPDVLNDAEFDENGFFVRSFSSWGFDFDVSFFNDRFLPQDIDTVELIFRMGDIVFESDNMVISSDVNALSVQLDSGTSSMNINAGSTLTLKDSYRVNNGSTVNVDGTLTDDGFKGLQLGAANQSAISVSSTGVVDATRGAIIDGNSNLTNNAGTLNLGDTSQISGNSTFANTGTGAAINMGGGTLIIDDSTAINDLNAVISNAGGLQVSNGGTFANTNGATIQFATITTTAEMVTAPSSPAFVVLSGGTFSNDSTTTVDLGNATALVSGANSLFTNDGMFENVLVFAVADGGVASNAGTFDLGGGSVLTTGTGSAFSNTGTIMDTDIFEVTQSGIATNTGTIELGNGTLSLDSGGVINNSATINVETITSDAGIINDNGTFGSVENLNLLNQSTLNINTAGETITNLAISNSTINNVQDMTFGTVTLSGAVSNLNGTGLVATTSVTNNGFLAANNGSGVFTITTPTFTQGADGTLQVSIDSTGASGTVNVTGVANIDGTLLLEEFTGGARFGMGDSITLFTASQINGSFDNLVWDQQLLDSVVFGFAQSGLSANTDIVVRAVRDYFNPALQAVLSPDQKLVVNLLDSVILPAGDPNEFQGSTVDLEAVLSEIDQLGEFNVGDPDDLAEAYRNVANAFDNMTPIRPDALQAAGMDHANGRIANMRRYTRRQSEFGKFNAAVKTSSVISWTEEEPTQTIKPSELVDDYYDRLAQRVLGSEGEIDYNPRDLSYTFGRRTSLSRQSEVTREVSRKFDVGAFISGSYQMGEADETATASSFEFDSFHFTGGVDMPIGEDFLIGLIFGVSSGTTDIDFNNSDFDTEGYSLGAFASYQGDWSLVDFSVAYSWLDYDINRNINFGGVNRTANSNPGATQFDVFLGGDINLVSSDSFSFGPTWSARYINLDMDDYRETGADSLNLAVNGGDYEAVIVEAGLNYQYASGADVGSYFINIFSTFQTAPISDGDSTRIRFADIAGSSTVSLQDSEDTDTFFNFGASFAWQWSEYSTLGVSYGLTQGLNGNNLLSHSLSADVDCHF